MGANLKWWIRKGAGQQSEILAKHLDRQILGLKTIGRCSQRSSARLRGDFWRGFKVRTTGLEVELERKLDDARVEEISYASEVCAVMFWFSPTVQFV